MASDCAREEMSMFVELERFDQSVELTIGVFAVNKSHFLQAQNPKNGDIQKILRVYCPKVQQHTN